MRVLKFRAWDSEKSVMMYDNKTALHDVDYWDGVSSSTVGLVNYQFATKFDWMQFTGLLDKHGKEIYESDLVKDTLTHCILKVCYGYNRNGGYTGWYVEYLNIDRNGFGSLNGDYSENQNSQIEVIGNIHEHPHLLTP